MATKFRVLLRNFRGENLTAKDSGGTSDPYLKVSGATAGVLGTALATQR